MEEENNRLEKNRISETSFSSLEGNESSENIHTLEENEENQIINLATSWPALSHVERKQKFNSLPRTEAEDLFLSLNTHDQAELITEFGHLEKRSWLRLLAPDDVADIIQEIGPVCKDEFLALLDPQTRREVTALLAYAEDNAGGLMSSRYARLRPEMSVDEAISYLRIQAKTQIETIYYAYVLDQNQVLCGVVSFRELFASNPNKQVKEIMKDDMIKIPINLDQEQIARIFSQQNLMALPVIDDEGRMHGIVTFDDVATVLQEEATEDIQKLGGVESLDAPYLKISLFELIRKRAGWLAILFLGEMFTATAMGVFKNEIEKAVVLALFIPLIISSGGNAGSQATSLIIRALALGEVRLQDWLRVLRREILCGFSLGLFLGAIGAMRIYFWPQREAQYGPYYLHVAVAVAASVLGVVMWGSICGSMLPFLLKKLKFDPATASAPGVATIVDVTGLVIYFTVASVVLKGNLL